ncbi:hypothetical protein L6164_028899 [Bauhinia variegata]|uniref:Uncharacterized protein n=1 Tax=Bauhinia variegata TaxID=167791 RepID=A0ACB9L7Z0_BAUVA|nr:hypothetical protein L6164_028899 [Bauhinia variegata]
MSSVCSSMSPPVFRAAATSPMPTRWYTTRLILGSIIARFAKHRASQSSSPPRNTIANRHVSLPGTEATWLTRIATEHGALSRTMEFRNLIFLSSSSISPVLDTLRWNGRIITDESLSNAR